MTRSALLLAVVTTLLGCAGEPDQPTATPFPGGRLVDLTHAYDSLTVYWPTASGFEMTSDFKGMTPGGWYYEANTFTSAEHGGTHLDAPIHFAEGRSTSDQVALDRLIGPAIVIDVREAAATDADYLVSIADFEAWEGRNGRIPDGSIVLVRTGFGTRWPDRASYMGTDERGPDAVSKLHFPGLSADAATWLATQRSIDAIGIDTPSIDRGQSAGFESHRILFEKEIPAFENVANLEALPETRFHVIALPMKIAGGSGGPLRIVAVLP